MFRISINLMGGNRRIISFKRKNSRRKRNNSLKVSSRNSFNNSNNNSNKVIMKMSGLILGEAILNSISSNKINNKRRISLIIK